MRRGEREFGLSVRAPVPYAQDWRGTYRWPFIALCVLLSLGVIASGDPGAPNAIPNPTSNRDKSPESILIAPGTTNAASTGVPLSAPQTVVDPEASPKRASITAMMPKRLPNPGGNEQAAR